MENSRTLGIFFLWVVRMTFNGSWILLKTKIFPPSDSLLAIRKPSHNEIIVYHITT